MTATYDKLELHLAPVPLSRAHAKRIKACGGRYSECRSAYSNRRYVTVPTSEAGLALIDELVRTYRAGTKMTMIARGGVQGFDSRPAWVVVQYVDPTLDEPPFEQFARKFVKAYVDAIARGIIR
jgi:hypothetical protein